MQVPTGDRAMQVARDRQCRNSWIDCPFFFLPNRQGGAIVVSMEDSTLLQDADDLMPLLEEPLLEMDDPAVDVDATPQGKDAKRGRTFGAKADASVPTKIGRYQVVSMLAWGSQSKVYLADDNILKQKVAIKELVVSDARARESFRREAKFLRELNSARNVIKIYEFLQKDGDEYIVREFVDGISLSNLIQRQGRLPVPMAMHIFSQICFGLCDAHDKGIILRDIKPGNVLISKDGDVKLSDFGVAATEQDLAEGKASAIGTPRSLSPEQMDPGGGVDRRTDIYSMGIMLYGMLFAEWPFTGNSIEELMSKVKRGDYVKPIERDPTVPTSVNDLIVKMMARDKEERFKDIHEVVREVDDYLAQFSSRSQNFLKSALKVSAHSEASLDYHRLALEDGKTVDLYSLGQEPV